MGNDARQRAWSYQGSQGERLLLLALAEHIPDTGHTCWPAVETLAGLVGVGNRQVQRIIRDLEDRGAIITHQGRGRGHTTLYGLLVGLSEEQRDGVKQHVKGDIATTPITPIKGDTKDDIAMSPLLPEMSPFIEEKVTSGDTKGDIAMSPRTEKEPKDSKRSHRDVETDPLFQSMFNAVAHACQIDLKLCTNAQRQQIAQTSKALRKAGKLPEEIPKVERWWYMSDWRGKKGEAPRPAQIQEVWQRAMTQEHTNGTNSGSRHANDRRPDIAVRRTRERLDGG